jgi:antitoxin StbD
MAIQKIKATKTASLTDLRDPMKVIEAAGDSTVAIMNRNKIVGYFVPESQTKAESAYLDRETFEKLLPEVLNEEKEVLEYLKDK